MLRITVEVLPGGDEAEAYEVARARICNLRHHEHGSPIGDYHGAFEAIEPPMRSELPPYEVGLGAGPRDPRATDHGVASTYVSGWPRFAGSVWDLIAALLEAGNRGWPMVAWSLDRNEPWPGASIAPLEGSEV